MAEIDGIPLADTDDLPVVDDDDLPRPSPVAVPPLPRLWKAEPEVVEEEAPAKPRKKKRGGGEAVEATPKTKVKKKKKAAVEENDGTGATKLAETPKLDTYEARQRARWIIGGVLGLVGIGSIFLVSRMFRGAEPENKEVVENREPAINAEAKAKAEVEANALVEIARQADKAGEVQAALVTLNKVAKNYQGTPSARLAMVAIARNRKKRSLFGTDADDHPTGPTPPPSSPTTAATSTSAPVGPARPAPVGPHPMIPTALGPTPPKEAAGPAPTRPETSSVADAVAPTSSKPIPVGFLMKPGATIHASGWPTEIVCNQDGAVMVLVPGTTFMMGREDGEAAEQPSHLVKVSTFYIDRQEVTAGQFEKFLKDTGRPSLKWSKVGPDLPATGMSAKEALEYCKWARRKLPTEAQWELAARSPTGKISYWNGTIPRPDPPKGTRTVEPVVSLPTDVSPYGAFDLAANAWEWTADLFDSHYYQTIKNGATDPTGPSPGRIKLNQASVRGGSPGGILTWREGVNITSRLPYLGFRGALSVEGSPVAASTSSPSGPKSPTGFTPPP